MRMLGAGLVFCLALWAVPGFSADSRGRVCSSKACVDVEVTKERPALTRGLAGRSALGAGQGMLFEFSADDRYAFWMKGMKFPIDMVWLDRNWRVVHVESNVPPCTEKDCPLFKPAKPSRYVLEVNAGHALRHGFQVGSLCSRKSAGPSQLSADDIERIAVFHRLLTGVEPKSAQEIVYELEQNAHPRTQLVIREAMAKAFADISREQQVQGAAKKQWLYSMVTLNMAYLQMAGPQEGKSDNQVLNRLIRQKLKEYLPPDIFQDPGFRLDLG